MTEAATEVSEPPRKSSKLGLILGLVLAIAGGGGGFYAVQSGLILAPEDSAHSDPEIVPDALPDIAFIELDPIIISLSDAQSAQHLRFRAQLEVNKAYQSDVELILPRVVDVLNGYLRALNPQDFRDPLALTRLRSQMLRRVQIVTGKGRVSDVLIMEFVLS